MQQKSVLATLLALSASLAFASQPQPHRMSGKTTRDNKPYQASPHDSVSHSMRWMDELPAKNQTQISMEEREIIALHAKIWPEEFETPTAINTADLPPGLQKRVAEGKGLPNGWQKKVVQGKVLPKDLRLYARPLSAELMAELAPQPAGTQLVVLDGKVIRLLNATQTTLDLFDL